VFALAFHSFLVGMRTHPPAKKLSYRMSLLTLLVILPWMVRPFPE
jgi:hypothetical protein